MSSLARAHQAILRTRLASISCSTLRRVLFGATFAILVSSTSVLVLCFGLIGSPGNSVFTGGLLTITTVAIALQCFRRNIVLLPADYLFIALILCIGLSFAFHGWTSTAKDYASLILSLAAYPACRFVSHLDMVSSRSWFTRTTIIIVAPGTIATAVALFLQWDDNRGKPLIFGFEGATYFLESLSFLVVTLVAAGKLTMRRTALISSLIFLPLAIFAASMVRLTFIALVGSVLAAGLMSPSKERKFVAIIAAVILTAVTAGLLTRHAMATTYIDFAFERTGGPTDPNRPPSCSMNINPNNSIAVRKALVQDAIYLIPTAGLFGTGLDSFLSATCIERHQIHNSILQATVEFGWLGGSLLLLIILMAGSSLISLARQDGAARFVLCSLVFVALLSLGSGIINRDSVLFAFLGCAVGLRETARAVVT